MADSKLSYSEALAILELQEGASADDIKRAYRKLAKKYHPDVYQYDDGEKFKKVSDAFHLLSNYQEVPQQQYRAAGNSLSRQEKKRRAYRKQQKEKRRQEEEQKKKMFAWIFSNAKVTVLVILLFNLLLAVDYFIPVATEEVKIARIETVNHIRYTNYNNHNQRRAYNYKLILDDGTKFNLDKNELGKVDANKTFLLEKSRIFQEPYSLKTKQFNGIQLYNEFGLFRVFGIFIPVTILLIGAYFYVVKNNDYRLSILLLIAFIFIFQLVLAF